MSRISIIAAISPGRVIGHNNKMPWDNKEEQRNFRNITEGATVIMGRKTFESIGGPLPNRNNVVVSRDMPEQPGIIVHRTLQEALARNSTSPVFIIGGASLYEQAMPLADTMYISIIPETHEGDTFFPIIPEREWKMDSVEKFPSFSFVTFKRHETALTHEN